MMGVGKSSIGKDLSYKLKMEFKDIDSIIEKKLSLSISEIFKKKGEKFYEVPINYNGRSYKEGKKIKPHDFFFVLFQIFLRRFF